MDLGLNGKLATVAGRAVPATTEAASRPGGGARAARPREPAALIR